MNKIGDNIKIARKRAGYTQLQLSELLKIGRSSLAQYESNIYEPSIEIINMIASILNIDVAELMGQKKNNPYN